MKRFARATRRLFSSRRELSPFAADFDPTGTAEPTDIVRLRLRRPILLGSLITLFLVFGLLVWATFFSIAGAVVAPGTVRVENNLKQLRYREGGVVRQILVHEGQLVQRGQVLLRFDQVTAQASVDILSSAHDNLVAQIARFQAEAAGAPDIRFPPELIARAGDPAVAQLIAGQRALFDARMMLYRSQAGVLRGQADQLQTQIAGMRAQAVATDAQSGLIDDELKGVADLNKLGYAPRSRLLALQRSAAQLKGQRGSVTSDIGRTTQAAGDIRLQIAQLDDRRQTDAADGLRDAQEKLSDNIPKLRAAQEAFDQTIVRAPVTGYVFNLTQFTEGGVAAPGESLMQIVPLNEPLIITAMVRPTDIADVREGMPARVTLTAYNARTTPQVDATVESVGADAQVDEATKATFYTVRVKVSPADLARAGPNVHLTPGMPATVAIVTGSRTIMDYLLGPMTEAMRTAMRER